MPKKWIGHVVWNLFATVGFVVACCCEQTASATNCVIAWGDNTYGQTNVPVTATNVQSIAAGYGFSVALKSNSTVIAWGEHGATNVPAGLSNVVAIAAGFGQTLALKKDGTLVSWGIPSTYSTYAATNIPAGLSNVTAIACGEDYNMALRMDGKVCGWGVDPASGWNPTNIPSGLSNVVSIAAGAGDSFGVSRDGTPWLSGSYPLSIAYTNVVVGAVTYSSQGVVLLGDGTAHAWYGLNETVFSNATAVASVCPYNQAGGFWILLRNGTLAGSAYGNELSEFLGQSNVWMSLSNVLAIASGYTHHLAIVGDSFPKPVEPMLRAGFSNGQFTISQPTLLGRSYRLEYKNSLADDWQMFPPAPGNGSTQILADPNPPPSQRFYHIHVGQ